MSWFCPRKNCLPCKGRLLLAKEEEDETLRMAGFIEDSEEVKTIRKKVWRAEDRIALPSCTTEGVNYCIECMECRSKGVRKIYYGETGRSPYQRGKENFNTSYLECPHTSWFLLGF